MGLEVFTEPNAQATLTGGLTVATNARTGDAGNLTVNGTITASGAASLPSNVTVGGTLTASGNVTASGNLTVVSLATLQQTGGGVKGGGASSNAATITNNATIALGVFRKVRVQATAACTSAALPTGTVDGQDLDVVNIGATAITVSTNVNTAVTLAATGAASFEWDAGTTLWYHKV